MCILIKNALFNFVIMLIVFIFALAIVPKNLKFIIMLTKNSSLLAVRKYLHEDLKIWCSICKRTLLVIPLKKVNSKQVLDSLLKSGLSIDDFNFLSDFDVCYFTFKS